jgi:iron-sulfur cluster assembly protein
MVAADIAVIERIPMGIEGAEKQDDFMVTANAVDSIKQIKIQNEVPEEYFLRIGTRMGGCSGIQYMLGFDSEVNENDRKYEHNGINLLVDNHSVFYLQGVTLDFTDGPTGSGFVFNNPNNEHTCGCSH